MSKIIFFATNLFAIVIVNAVICFAITTLGLENDGQSIDSLMGVLSIFGFNVAYLFTILAIDKHFAYLDMYANNKNRRTITKATTVLAMFVFIAIFSGIAALTNFIIKGFDTSTLGWVITSIACQFVSVCIVKSFFLSPGNNVKIYVN